MCELFYIKSLDDNPIPRHRIRDFIDMAELGSYSNHDGTGAFNRSGVVFKTEEALHSMKSQEVVDKLEGSHEIVLHVRMSTRGSVCDSNAHPFEHEDRVLAHNGTMHSLDNPESDSVSVDSEKFLYQTVETEAETEVERLKNSLERTSGWLSIFYRDVENGNTYYFRNRASFEFGRTSEEIVGATDSSRLDALNRYRNQERFKIQNRFEPEEEVIYRISGSNIGAVEEYDLASEVSRGYARSSTHSSGYYRDRVRSNSSSRRYTYNKGKNSYERIEEESDNGIGEDEPLEELYEERKSHDKGYAELHGFYR